jgi:hypothetical protein
MIFFSDGENEVEQFVRRKRAVMQLRSKNLERQAQITSQSSCGVDLEEVHNTITAPTFSFDWQARQGDDEDDEDNGGFSLEVGVPEQDARKDSRRGLLKESIQRSVSLRLAQELLPKDHEKAGAASTRQGHDECADAGQCPGMQVEDGAPQPVEEEDDDGLAIRSRRRHRVFLEDLQVQAESMRGPEEGQSKAAEEPGLMADRSVAAELEVAPEATAKAAAEANASVEAKVAEEARHLVILRLAAESDAKSKATTEADVKLEVEAEAKAIAEAEATAEVEVKAKAIAEADAKSEIEVKVKDEVGPKAKADAEAEDHQKPKTTGANTQKRKLKQMLLLDMFKRSFTTNFANRDKDAQANVSAVDAAPAAPLEQLPSMWKSALEGAFPALRRLCRLRHLRDWRSDIDEEKLKGLAHETFEANTKCVESEAECESEEFEGDDLESEASGSEEAEEREADTESEDNNAIDVEMEENAEEVMLSAEDIRRHRNMLRQKRREARKLERKLGFELEDMALIRDEVERMVHLGTSTMTEEDQLRWKQLVGAAFACAPPATATQKQAVHRAIAQPGLSISTSHVPVEVVTPAAGRRLFGGRKDDEGGQLYALAGNSSTCASFMRSRPRQK